TVQHHRVDDVGAVFVAAGGRDIGCASQHFSDGGVILFTPRGPVIRITSGLAQVARPAVTLDQVRSFAEVGDILRKVTAALRDKRPKVAHDLEADGIAFIHFGYPGQFAQARIHVLTPEAQLDKPGVVVNTCTAPFQLLVGDV